MFYENELRFLCEILKKCRVKVSFKTPNDPILKVLDDNFRMLFVENNDVTTSIKDFLIELKPNTIYKLSSPFKLNYLFFLLPHTTNETVMSIGPFLSDKVDYRLILEIGEKYFISPAKQKTLRDYYSSIPVITESDRLFMMIDTFAERIWGGVGSFTMVDANNDLYQQTHILNKVASDNQDDVLVNMKLMENRYDYENEIMLAVSLGNDHKVAQIMSNLSIYNFDRRVADSVRNLKNYCIVMNTLLRKAAEEGGVHPIYLDELSSSYAIKIEQLSTTELVHELMSDMLKSYCRLVRKHSTKKYSSTVQKTITLIDYDLSANLTLSSLAKTQNISSGYLSSIFKKETGKTITEYILDKRVNHAMRLLGTTRLQVQTVALHCGIMDVQYFSKIFKRKTGKTPKEFRESVKMN